MEPFFTPQVTTLNRENVSLNPREITPKCPTTLRIDQIWSESNADNSFDVKLLNFPICPNEGTPSVFWLSFVNREFGRFQGYKR